MGAKNNKSNEINQNNNRIERNLNKGDLCLSKLPNPVFKKVKSITDYTFTSFEIYQLKNDDKFFYLALALKNDGIIIYKYSHINNDYKEVNRIKTYIKDLPQIIIKYFYNPLNNKEYLFIVKSYEDMEIYLIKDEKEYIFINKEKTLLNQFQMDLRNSIHDTSYIKLFDIIYNQYDNYTYIITSCILGELENDDFYQNFINIKIYKTNKLKLIQNFSFKTNNTDGELNMIYEDKSLKKYYILLFNTAKIELIEIKKDLNKNNVNFIELINISETIELTANLYVYFDKTDKNICIINYDNNEYLYICFKEKPISWDIGGGDLDEEEEENIKKNSNLTHLLVFDLLTNKFVKRIIFHFKVNSMLNWNNKYLLLSSDNSFYFFDVKNNKLITKYSDGDLKINENKKINSIKSFISVKDNFYGLFILNDKLDIFSC